MKLRVKFSKHGPVRFIGHLDVMRYFQKTIRRAEIDIAYSVGFNPHQIMSFAAPLGVGLESNGEYMDIEVHSMTSCEDVKNRLNEAGVPQLQVLSVTALQEGAKNAMASVAAASYTVSFREGKAPELKIAELLPAFLAKAEILYTKTGKKGSREVDLRPGIYECRWEAEHFTMLLDASSGGNIKPAQVVEALLAEAGETLQQNGLFVTREELYSNAGTPESPEFVPLDQGIKVL